MSLASRAVTGGDSTDEIPTTRAGAHRSGAVMAADIPGESPGLAALHSAWHTDGSYWV